MVVVVPQFFPAQHTRSITRIFQEIGLRMSQMMTASAIQACMPYMSYVLVGSEGSMQVVVGAAIAGGGNLNYQLPPQPLPHWLGT